MGYRIGSAWRGCAAAALLALSPLAVHAQSFAFDRVEVEGNQRVDAATIVSFAGIERGAPLTAAELNDAFQAISDSGLFESVELVPRGGTLVIRVQEFPTLNVVAFEGNRRLDDEALEAIVQSRSRRVYSPSTAEADAAAITEAYRQSGRIAAIVEPKLIRRTENRVDLVFEITEGAVTEIERLSFVGNRAYSDRRLRRVLETKQAGIFRQFIRRDTFVEDRIEFDRQVLTDFYQSRGYVDFQVLSVTPELNRNRDGFLLTFTVQEGQQFRVGEVTVTSDLASVDPDLYLEATRLRSGVVYSPTLIERDIARLERLAVQQGENFIRIEPRISRNDRDLTLDVEYVVSRGQRLIVERIDIEGNTATLDRVIRREFRVVEGDPFNPREIRESAERIRALGFFEEAQVQAREGTAEDRVIVDVDVEEASTGSLGFGGSYSTNSGFGVTLSLTERNFLGRGQQLEFELGTTGDTATFTLDFTEPSFLGRDVAFGLDASYRETERDFALYNTRRGQLSPSLTFPIGENARLGVRGAVSYSGITDVDRGTADDPDTAENEFSTGSSAILREEEDLGDLLSFSLGYTLSYHTRRTGLDPTAGVLLSFSQDFGVREDDATFIRTTFSARARKAILNEEVNLRAEFDAGAVMFDGGPSRIVDRFTLNGRMRGFEPNGVGPRDLATDNEDALGGNIFAVARFEADFPLGLPEEYGISGGVFYDIGSVWSLDNTAGGPDGNSKVDDGYALRSAAGISIFWETPIGPLRFNFSRPILQEDYDEERNFELTVFTRF